MIIRGFELAHDGATNAAMHTSTTGSYGADYNQNPKPFIWTAKATGILEKAQCAWKKLEK